MHRRVTLPVLLSFLCLGAAPQTARAPRGTPQWFTVGQDYSSQRYVALDQITTKNVGKLAKVCELDLNAAGWFSSGILMVDGILYVNTVVSTFAIDAATCALVWRYDLQLNPWTAAVSNRGAAYDRDLGLILRGTADGRIVALDAKTGSLKWQQQTADPTRLEAYTSAPIAYDRKLFTGIVTADLGVRGRIQAFDTQNDGRTLWTFHTIPVGIEPGAETWPTPSQSSGNHPAGGAFWTSYSLDPATGELFGPVSNPNPDYIRPPGELSNLYTNSVISLDASTGALNWYCQTISGDTHDWDLGTPPTLYQSKSGKKLLAIAGKSGYVTVIDRSSPVVANAQCQKTIVFATPGTTVPQTPEPPVDGKLRLVRPGSLGGAEWNGTAYHPELGILYSGMVDFGWYYSTQPYTADPGFWTGSGGTVRADFSTPPSGWITAMDGETGKVLWRHHADAQVLTGLVPTGGGLLFGGDVRGNLLALDAKTGQVLKKIDAGGALNNGLISYAIGERQYVAVTAGGITLNPSGVSGPLRVVLYGLPDGRPPIRDAKAPARAPLAHIRATSDAPPASGSAPQPADPAAWSLVCSGCHGATARGAAYPPLLRHTELANGANGFAVLKDFLRNVPPPMPVLYPGLLSDPEVESIGAVLKLWLSSPANNDQLANSAPLGYVYKQPTTNGTPQWQAIYSVLTYPRCINCHTKTNYPRQRDMRYPHIYSVVRGTDDSGAPVARCHHCHGTENNPERGIPGAPDWHLAPLAMAWESAPGIAMSGPELCASLQNRLLNGDRGLPELLAHLDTPLVRWAWHPGTRWNGEPRTKPPISHEELMRQFKQWMDAGAPCPSD